MTPSSVLWLVTARSGSKGIPDKNIKPLRGIPLLGYRIQTALASRHPSEVWITTDSPRYAELAVAWGARVPFLRPEHLSTDQARSIDVVLHAMAWAESNGYCFKAVGLLEPTSPFTKTAWLDEAVDNLLQDPDAKTLVAVREARPSSYYVQPAARYLDDLYDRIRLHGVLRRQDEAMEVTPSGNLYLAKWEALKEEKNFYSSRTLMQLIPDPYGLEIDQPLDWAWAEFLLEKTIISQAELGIHRT